MAEQFVQPPKTNILPFTTEAECSSLAAGRAPELDIGVRMVLVPVFSQQRLS